MLEHPLYICGDLKEVVTIMDDLLIYDFAVDGEHAGATAAA